MSIFSKEELEDILNWGECYTEYGTSWVYELHKPLLDKIKSMLDNYEDN